MPNIFRFLVQKTIFISSNFIFYSLVITFLFSLHNGSESLKYAPGLIYLVGALVLIAVSLFLPNRGALNKATLCGFLLWSGLFCLFVPLSLMNTLLGATSFSSVLTFLEGNMIVDASELAGSAYLFELSQEILIFLLMLAIAFFLYRKKKYFGILLVFPTIALLISNPVTRYYSDRIVNKEVQTQLLATAKERGIELTNRPEERKNIILVYLESLEQTFETIPETEQAFKPLADIVNNGMRSTNVMQVAGTEITIKGLVATQCGIPLLPNGLANIADGRYGKESYSSILPHQVCLGDILKEDGYVLSYMNGADVNKFSKKGFMLTHGYTRLFDVNSVPKAEQEGHINSWGLNDEVLFEHVSQEIDALNQLDQPFLLSFLTIATHGPDGFLDTTCKQTKNQNSTIPDTIYCTAKHLEKLFYHLEETNLLDDTVVVVMSDHLSHRITLQNALDQQASNRRNLFSIIDSNSPKTIAREASMMDAFPTILETLGYSLKDDIAYLGTSLLSENTNLVEQFGAEQLSNGIASNFELSDYFWNKK